MDVVAYSLPDAVRPFIVWAGAIVVVAGATAAFVKLYRWSRGRVGAIADEKVREHEEREH